MTNNGIQTVIHYPIPPHKQLAYSEYNHLSFPYTEKIHKQTVSLPMDPTLSGRDVKYIIDVVNKF